MLDPWAIIIPDLYFYIEQYTSFNNLEENYLKNKFAAPKNLSIYLRTYSFLFEYKKREIFWEMKSKMW